MNSKPVSPLATSALANLTRLHLARQVFDATFETTDSFRELNVGADLAYLIGAILGSDAGSADRVDWRAEEYGGSPALLEILRPKFPAGSPLWQFIVCDSSPLPAACAAPAAVASPSRSLLEQLDRAICEALYLATNPNASGVTPTPDEQRTLDTIRNVLVDARTAVARATAGS